MIYGYARVSTETQKLDLQLKALKGCDKIYKEQASSIQHRPELIKLLALIQPGDTLKVYKLDRLGRSTIDLINIVTHLKENNIQFISVTDNIDTSTATGKLLFTVFAAFAEFERNLISERTIAGLKATKENGTILGRPFKWDKKTAREVIKMKKQHYTVDHISKVMNIPRSTIYRLLAVRQL